MKKIERAFYDRDSVAVARELLGKKLVHEVNGVKLAAKIVEAEAYMGVTDRAAHSYGGRRTPRVEVMYGGPGYAYVFFVYGMHYCFNVVTRGEGIPQAVLIRAAEPAEGLDAIARNRYGEPLDNLTKNQVNNLTNGPGKLCRALGIDRTLNGEDLCGGRLYIEEGEKEPFRVSLSKRVGVDYAGEDKDRLWRFYIEGSKYVSVK